jgi:hypothetical protein
MITTLQKNIVETLGVSEAGLRVLAKLYAGRRAWGGNTGAKLERQGYVRRPDGSS